MKYYFIICWTPTNPSNGLSVQGFAYTNRDFAEKALEVYSKNQAYRGMQLSLLEVTKAYCPLPQPTHEIKEF